MKRDYEIVQQEGLAEVDGTTRPRLFGFDITEGMVDLARQRLVGYANASQLRQGDLLNSESYIFGRAKSGFDIIFAYDVIQQLPPNLQFEACELMVRNLAPRGVAMVFDHDRHSSYGQTMAFKKFVTNYLRVALVPRYYCNASYPPLAGFAARLAESESGESGKVAIF